MVATAAPDKAALTDEGRQAAREAHSFHCETSVTGAKGLPLGRFKYLLKLLLTETIGSASEENLPSDKDLEAAFAIAVRCLVWP